MDEFKTTIDAFDGPGDVPVTVEYLVDDGIRIQAVRLESGCDVLPQMEDWELKYLTHAIARHIDWLNAA